MIDGFFFDGKSSARVRTKLYFDDSGRYHFDHDATLNGQFSELTIAPRIGSTARYITLANGAQFETLDNDSVDTIVKQFSAKKTTGIIHLLERNRSIVISTMVAVVLFSWVFVQYGVPYFSNQVAMMLPEKVPQMLGKGVLESMDKHWLSKTELSDERQDELQTLFENLKQTLGKLEFVHLELRKGGPLGANAFALPDGTVVFTDEIIALAENDHEIEAIMYHEIGHIEHRHAIRSVIQQFSMAIFVMAITGDVSTSSSIITAIPVLLVEAGFSQDMEWEADTYALDHMLENKIDPNHFATMMKKLAESHERKIDCKKEKESKDNCDKEEKILTDKTDNKTEDKTASKDEKTIFDYMSTHPPTFERIERFKNHSSH